MTKPKPKNPAAQTKAAMTAKVVKATTPKPASACLRTAAAPKASAFVTGTGKTDPIASDVHFTHLDEVLEQCRMDVPGFEPLASVLRRAYDQAAMGKGVQRHGQGQPFVEQPMQQLVALHGCGFAIGQASKKASEAQRMLTLTGAVEPAVHELLGAIVYLAGTVVALELDAKRAQPFVRA